MNRQYAHQIGTSSEQATIIVPAIDQHDLLKELAQTDTNAASSAVLADVPARVLHIVSAPPQGLKIKVIAKLVSEDEITSDGTGGEAWFYESLWRGGKVNKSQGRFVLEKYPPPAELAAFVPKFLGHYQHMGRRMIVLSDLCGFDEAPCVADVRVCLPPLSRKTLQELGYNIKSEVLKNSATSISGAYAVTGYRRWEAGKDSNCEVTDVYGQAQANLNESDMLLSGGDIATLKKLAAFLRPASTEMGLAVIHGMRQRVSVFEKWARHNFSLAEKAVKESGSISGRTVFGLGHGVSVLLTYNGEDRNNEGNAWLIDFEGAGWRDLSTEESRLAAFREAYSLWTGLRDLRLDLNLVEDKLRRRAVDVMSKRIKSYSNVYIARTLFEVLDKRRKGSLDYKELLKMIAFDPIVRDALNLVCRHRSKRTSSLLHPRRLRKRLIAALKARSQSDAIGGQLSSLSHGGSDFSSSAVNGIGAGDLEQILWE